MIKDLYEHNRIPAIEIFEHFQSGAKSVLYTSGVGCGKTYVAEAIMEELGAKRVAYIIPKYSIKEDIETRTVLAEKFDIDFFTYNTFNEADKCCDTLAIYDLVIIDEAHHLGSDIYGSNLVYAMERLANTKVLGLTATPIREDKVNVNIYFEKEVNGITVMDAQRLGLMPQYEYIICNPDLKEIREKNIGNKNFKIDFENSEDLLEDIIKTNPKNKWIIYFVSVKEMNDNEELYRRLFPDYEILKLSAKDGNLSEAMELMYSDKKCIIMSVSILLEGIHAPNIGGIILCRNINSIPVFDQILGRVSRIGATESPVIIDCTNTAHRMRKKLSKADEEATKKGKYARYGSGIVTHNSMYVSLKNSRYVDIAQMLYENRHGRQTVMGYTFSSNLDLSRQLDKSNAYVGNLKKQGCSYEEIITKATKSQTVMGYTFASDSDLSRQLDKCKAYVGNLKKQGCSYEEIICQALKTSKPSKTVMGYTFTSDADLSRQLGKPREFISRWLKIGLTYEEIITRAINGKTQTVMGYTFTSDTDLSRQLGKYNTYVNVYRKQYGKTYEEIIALANENKK